MVIDSHTHAWGPPTKASPWVNEPLIQRVTELDVDEVYASTKLLNDMDDVGVDEAVVVGFPIVDWVDNSYVIEAVQEHDRLSGIGMADPFAENAAETLRELLAVDHMLGFRLGALFPYEEMWEENADPDQTWLRHAIEERDFWRTAQETDALVQLLVHQAQLDQIVELVETYPDVTYAIDHLARADVSTPPDDGGLSGLAQLTDYGNVLVKASAVPYLSTEEFPYKDVHDHIRWLLDRFGRERMVWGSDYPYVSDIATYRESREWIEHVEGLSSGDIEWITSRSFTRAVTRS